MLSIKSISITGHKTSLVYSPENDDFTLLISQEAYEYPEQYNEILCKAVNKIKSLVHNELHI